MLSNMCVKPNISVSHGLAVFATAFIIVGLQPSGHDASEDTSRHACTRCTTVRGGVPASDDTTPSIRVVVPYVDVHHALLP